MSPKFIVLHWSADPDEKLEEKNKPFSLREGALSHRVNICTTTQPQDAYHKTKIGLSDECLER